MSDDIDTADLDASELVRETAGDGAVLDLKKAVKDLDEGHIKSSAESFRAVADALRDASGAGRRGTALTVEVDGMAEVNGELVQDGETFVNGISDGVEIVTDGSAIHVCEPTESVDSEGSA